MAAVCRTTRDVSVATPRDGRARHITRESRGLDPRHSVATWRARGIWLARSGQTIGGTSGLTTIYVIR
jgi:hypothetical protein